MAKQPRSSPRSASKSKASRNGAAGRRRTAASKKAKARPQRVMHAMGGPTPVPAPSVHITNPINLGPPVPLAGGMLPVDGLFDPLGCAVSVVATPTDGSHPPQAGLVAIAGNTFSSQVPGLVPNKWYQVTARATNGSPTAAGTDTITIQTA